MTPDTAALVACSYVRIGRRDRAVHRTHVVATDLLVDCDADGKVLGIELIGWTDIQTAMWRVLCEAVMPSQETARSEAVTDAD